MTKLKQCPFCGGEAEMNRILNSDGEPEYYISVCKKHDCPGNVREVYKSEEMAIKVWNTRTPEIVRCGECEHYEKADNLCTFSDVLTCSDWFCRYGKGREEE